MILKKVWDSQTVVDHYTRSLRETKQVRNEAPTAWAEVTGTALETPTGEGALRTPAHLPQCKNRIKGRQAAPGNRAIR